MFKSMFKEAQRVLTNRKVNKTLGKATFLAVEIAAGYEESINSYRQCIVDLELYRQFYIDNNLEADLELLDLCLKKLPNI